MRLANTAALVCLSLLAWALEPAAAQSASPAVQSFDSTAGQSEAAEKHAKRTACIKDAKSKKLVGPQKTAYVKDCMAGNLPPEPQNSPGSAAP